MDAQPRTRSKLGFRFGNQSRAQLAAAGDGEVGAGESGAAADRGGERGGAVDSRSACCFFFIFIFIFFFFFFS